MTAWKTVKLSEVCEIQRGGSPRPIENFMTEADNGINWIKIGDVAEGEKYITTTREKIKPEGAKRSREVENGDFLLSNSMSFGRPYILRTSGCIHDGWLVLRYNKKLLTEDYLYHVLGSDFVYAQFVKFAVGAVVKNLNCEVVRQVSIPLPPLLEQRRIASILDQADALRAKRREALAELDRLISSTFIETFGNPITNPNGYTVFPLGEICDVRDGTHDSPKYVEDGFPLLTSKNLSKGYVDLADANLISESDYKQINKRSKVDVGDLLMPMIGTIGNPVLIKEQPNYAVKNVAIIKFHEKSPSNIFIREILKSSYFDYIVSQKNKGGTQKFLSLGDIRSLPIPVPDYASQNQFSHQIDAIGSLYLIQQKSLDETERLFISLQSKAFQGNL